MATQSTTGRSMTEEDVKSILDVFWEQIALFAFENYKESGRGVIFLDRQGLNDDILLDQVDLGFAVYEPGRPDPEVARMVAEYDPAWEIVIQYLQPDGRIRTTRIRTAPGNRHPWRIYLFDRLMREEEEERE